MDKSFYEQAEDYYRCIHLRKEHRYYLMSDGRKSYHNQCLDCGFKDVAIKKSSISKFFIDTLKPIDQDLIQKHNSEILKMSRELAEKAKKDQYSDWSERYQEYLKSPEWIAKKAQVIERDKNICQGCLKNKPYTAHHLKYYPNFDEPLFYLVAICKECHDKIHSIESGQY